MWGVRSERKEGLRSSSTGTACGTGPWAADFNADAVANVLDLIELLLAFGMDRP